jgi:DNA-binding transcriptional ArsR family regulator
MLTYEDVKAVHEIFNGLAQPNRLKIINTLHQYTELTVGNLCEYLQLDQGLVSHHLRILTNIGIVELRKNGKYAHYSINYVKLALVRSLAKDLSE